MADDQRPLAPYVHFTATDAEVDETWQRLDGSLRPERSPLKWFVLAGAVAAVAVVIGFGVLHKPTEGLTLESGTAIATGTAPLTGTLREGSIVQAEVASSGAVEVVSANQVRVRIDRGVMRFDVAKNPARRFSVVAGDVEVRVVGTRFVVRREAIASVQVERGVVEVWKGGAQRAVLTAGQSWEEPRQAVAPLEPDTQVEAEAESEVEADEPTEPSAPSKPVKKKTPKHKRPIAAAKDDPLPAPVPSTTSEPDPSTLFKIALDARRAGQAPEAASAFRTFLSSFPNDSRAGLAHFELGRLQMDRLEAPSSAIDSLEQSIARSPSGSHVEDAMARLVRLHDQLRHAKACSAAKTAYLGRFPSGVHAATLERLCDF